MCSGLSIPGLKYGHGKMERWKEKKGEKVL